MAYVNPNYATKKALKEAVARGEVVTVFNPGLGQAQTDGMETIEGPHYPKPHTWYAQVKVSGGRVVSVQ